MLPGSFFAGKKIKQRIKLNLKNRKIDGHKFKLKGALDIPSEHTFP